MIILIGYTIIVKRRLRALNEKMIDKWVGISEAADYLGVSKDTIRSWIRKYHKIPAHKIGKQWKFKTHELDEWVKSGGSEL